MVINISEKKMTKEASFFPPKYYDTYNPITCHSVFSPDTFPSWLKISFHPSSKDILKTFMDIADLECAAIRTDVTIR